MNANYNEKELLDLLELPNNEKIKPKKIAKHAMIKPVFLFENDDSKTIIKKLKKENTNTCIVITKDKKFIGEISVEDLIKLFVEQIKEDPLVQVLNIGYKKKFQYKSAKQLINKHKTTVNINDSINKVIFLIYKDGFNYLPVLDNKEKVAGVITPSSLINFLQNE